MAVLARRSEPAKTASRANPALRRSVPARRPASYGGVWENRPRYDRAASSGSVVDGDPLNEIDPSGELPWLPLVPAAAGGGAFGEAAAGGCAVDIETGCVASALIAVGGLGLLIAGKYVVDHLCPNQPLYMSKGGTQNKSGEYSRAAQQQPDPCAWLREQYNSASSSIERNKIKAAQKVLGCRRAGGDR